MYEGDIFLWLTSERLQCGIGNAMSDYESRKNKITPTKQLVQTALYASFELFFC